MGHFSGTELGRLLSKLLNQEALFSESAYETELNGGLNQLKKQLVTESMKLWQKTRSAGKFPLKTCIRHSQRIKNNENYREIRVLYSAFFTTHFLGQFMAEKPLDQELTQTEQRQSRLKELIARGKEQGYLTYAEVNDHLPEEIADPDQVEDIIRMIGDMGIAVGEEAPDDDQLLLGENSAATDDSAAEEAAAALASVENDVGRTTDPVRMYMREMGTVELLTREGEIVIAKRIEEGIREVMQAMAYYP